MKMKLCIILKIQIIVDIKIRGCWALEKMVRKKSLERDRELAINAWYLHQASTAGKLER